MSAAKAICDHMRDWWQGTKDVRLVEINFLFYVLNNLEYMGFNGFNQ
jgi:hypothetical protein